ncbi:Protein of unknown function [Gryllus bimaculatus]|nr:Protein of unknown function [Gryllus bimaculatus]
MDISEPVRRMIAMAALLRAFDAHPGEDQSTCVVQHAPPTWLAHQCGGHWDALRGVAFYDTTPSDGITVSLREAASSDISRRELCAPVGVGAAGVAPERSFPSILRFLRLWQQCNSVGFARSFSETAGSNCVRSLVDSGLISCLFTILVGSDDHQVLYDRSRASPYERSRNYRNVLTAGRSTDRRWTPDARYISLFGASEVAPTAAMVSLYLDWCKKPFWADESALRCVILFQRWLLKHAY